MQFYLAHLACYTCLAVSWATLEHSVEHRRALRALPIIGYGFATGLGLLSGYMSFAVPASHPASFWLLGASLGYLAAHVLPLQKDVRIMAAMCACAVMCFTSLFYGIFTSAFVTPPTQGLLNLVSVMSVAVGMLLLQGVCVHEMFITRK